MFGADVPVLLHIAARLPHEPHRAYVGRPAAASIEKPAIHGGDTHNPQISTNVLKNPCFLADRGGFSLESAAPWHSGPPEEPAQTANPECEKAAAVPLTDAARTV